MNKKHVLAAFASAALLLLVAAPAAAAQGDDLGWSDTAEFSFVATDGNSNGSALGFKNTLKRTWEKSSFTLRAGGIRVESSPGRFSADTGGSDVRELPKETSAESYYFNGRYDRKITERFFWFAGAGWDRNRPAGIEDRWTGFGGVGNVWVKNDKVLFQTDYAVTYTDETDVVFNPTVDDSYAGLRFSWVYTHKFNDSTTYGNDFVVDENLDETSDYRGDMTNWVAVSINKFLSLKVSLQLLYDNEPALETLTVRDPVTLVPTGDPDVTVPVDDLDTVFTASLVVNF